MNVRECQQEQVTEIVKFLRNFLVKRFISSRRKTNDFGIIVQLYCNADKIHLYSI